MSKINNTKTVTTQLIDEIKEALESVKFGSIEIFIQNKIVTQITVRNIRKTSVEIQEEEKVQQVPKQKITANKRRQIGRLH